MNDESMQDQLRTLQNTVARLERESAKPAPRKKPSRLARIAITAAMFLIPVVAFGVTITKPYTFVSGQPISASELNANFDTVYDRVNELGMYKLKAGSTVLGDVLTVSSQKAATIITDKEYVTTIQEFKSGSPVPGILSGVTYHAVSDCSDAPLIQFVHTKAVVNILQYPSVSLYYGTGTLPTAVPGYIKTTYSGCGVNFQAGTQTVGDFTTALANDESVTGVPNTVSGTLSIALQ